MAEFYASVTTDAGIALAADLLVGEQIMFTKLVTGSGVYEGEDLQRTSLRKATGLRDQKQEFSFSSITKETDYCVLLKALLSNAELTEGYRMTEVGVYAKKPGGGDEILYSISVAKEADYFPRYNGMVAIEIIEDYYITVSDAAQVTIERGRGAAALLEDFDRFRQEVHEKIIQMGADIRLYLDQQLDSLQRQIGDLSQLMTEHKGSLVDAVNEIAETVRPLIEYGIATDKDIDDIIADAHVDDVDWATTLDIAEDSDIDLIISGGYEGTSGDEPGAATDADIDAIISGEHVDEEEDGEIALTKIDRIVKEAF